MINKRDLFEMYLAEELQKAEDNYKKWQESYDYYLLFPSKASSQLITYYKRETEVAYELWQFKLKCFSKKIHNKSLSEE